MKVKAFELEYALLDGHKIVYRSSALFEMRAGDDGKIDFDFHDKVFIPKFYGTINGWSLLDSFGNITFISDIHGEDLHKGGVHGENLTIEPSKFGMKRPAKIIKPSFLHRLFGSKA